MTTRYAVTWREPEGATYAGSLEFRPGALAFEQREKGRVGVRHTVLYDDVYDVRIEESAVGRPTLLVEASEGEFRIGSTALDAGIVEQLAERVSTHQRGETANTPFLERVAVTARLRDGSAARAKELIAAGPPFDLKQAGLTQHTVYVGQDIAVFVFEGPDVSQRVARVVNDRLTSAAFSAWRCCSPSSQGSRTRPTTGIRTGTPGRGS